jgi:hypothetical protein
VGGVSNLIRVVARGWVKSACVWLAAAGTMYMWVPQVPGEGSRGAGEAPPGLLMQREGTVTGTVERVWALGCS